MRKVSEKPKAVTGKIEVPEGVSTFIDLRSGKVTKRHNRFTVPVTEVETDKPGYKKFEASTGHVIYFIKSVIPDKVTGKRYQNTLIIDGHVLKFMAMHETAVSRLLFSCTDALNALKEDSADIIKSRLEWTDWNAYRNAQKTLRVRTYSHDRFYSDHVKNVNDAAKS